MVFSFVESPDHERSSCLETLEEGSNTVVGGELNEILDERSCAVWGGDVNKTLEKTSPRVEGRDVSKTVEKTNTRVEGREVNKALEKSGVERRVVNKTLENTSPRLKRRDVNITPEKTSSGLEGRDVNKYLEKKSLSLEGRDVNKTLKPFVSDYLLNPVRRVEEFDLMLQITKIVRPLCSSESYMLFLSDGKVGFKGRLSRGFSERVRGGFVKELSVIQVLKSQGHPNTDDLVIVSIDG